MLCQVPTGDAARDEAFVGAWPSSLPGAGDSMGSFGRQGRNVRMAMLQEEAQVFFADASCPVPSANRRRAREKEPVL
jgi:hypothetical protein